MNNSYEDGLLVAAAERRKQHVAETKRLTTFGRNHGGSGQLLFILGCMQVFGFVSAFVVAAVLRHSTMNVDDKSAWLLAGPAAAVFFDIVSACLYLRVRYVVIAAAIIIAFLALCIGAFLGLAALV